MLEQEYGFYKLEATCYDCKDTQYVLVYPPEFERYQRGELVQNVWPDCDTWWREVVVGWRTGWFQCQTCNEHAIAEEELCDS